MRPADLLAIAAPAARAQSVPIPSAGEADAFSRALDSQLRQSAVDDGHCGTTGAVPSTDADATSAAEANGTRPAASPVREGPHGQSFGVQAHLAQIEARAARAEWRDFLQGLRDAGLIGGVRTDAASGLTGKGTPTALVADPGTSTPKPAPESTTPFSQALDALGAAIQAAIADPSANPAQPGQLPSAVQSALDAAAALAPPALQARMQAFADRLANGLGAAMAAASGETPAPTTTKTAKGSNGADSPVAQAILAAVAGAGEGADLSALRALHEKVAPARSAASAPADPGASTATTPGPSAKPAADQPGAARVADTTPASQPPGADATATRLEDAAARTDLAAVTDTTPGRAELTSQATPAASAPAAEAHVATLVAARGAPELVAQMAAVISRKLEGRITRFNMELNPAEMGRVDVRLSINSDGRVAAQMAFDNPAAAADMRGKADELRRQLEQSGFNVASEDLTFSDRQTGQGFQRQDQTLADPDIARARAFREADRNARLAEDAGRLSNRAILGLDMRV